MNVLRNCSDCQIDGSRFTAGRFALFSKSTFFLMTRQYRHFFWKYQENTLFFENCFLHYKCENKLMRTVIEKAIVQMLNNYLKKENISQIELANRLGWSPQDLNDTLKGRKPIGKNRQAHISKKLGSFFDFADGYYSAPSVKKGQMFPYGFNSDDAEIAQLISKRLTNNQKKTLKAFIKSLEKEK